MDIKSKLFLPSLSHFTFLFHFGTMRLPMGPLKSLFFPTLTGPTIGCKQNIPINIMFSLFVPKTTHSHFPFLLLNLQPQFELILSSTLVYCFTSEFFTVPDCVQYLNVPSICRTKLSSALLLMTPAILSSYHS